MTITIDDVAKIAKLANLALTEQEKTAFAAQLSAIVDYMEKLNELDTSNVPPMSHSTLSAETYLRPDQPRKSLGTETALANAPDAKDDHFRVPKVI
ncbi:MAG: Asp-tRNA(Asn)/Glu-tRNA(Gln) amidotransferase subunit GatC [Acidobacteriota bacterium]|nr:Asp-tRNA(Asn)/Glu-tRNA(Gln) amidotransferase subunit GatC [Blastocatellia bacterium]MDW8413417.1 Asp-tRNA(Asn)/Glu-tRNA(Gln) amidotransferase subunit GatC [Acidobacteriota bacterium]